MYKCAGSAEVGYGKRNERYSEEFAHGPDQGEFGGGGLSIEEGRLRGDQEGGGDVPEEI